MLIIPIAQKESTVRRMPWISFALIGANVLCFIATLVFFVAAGGRAKVAKQLDQVESYLVERPYLTLQSELLERLGPGVEETLREAREKSLGRTPPEAQVLDEQRQLDGLCQDALDAIRSLPSYRLGYVPRQPHLASVLSHMFTHAGWLHLFGNMLFLFLSGPFLEDLYGRVLFAALYLLGGLAALGAHVVQAPDSVLPLVGASGAIAGVMGAFLVRLAAARIQFLVLPVPFLPFLRFTMFLPAFVVLPIWAATQYLYAHIAKDAGVAWWAHLGGFGFGIVAALAIRLSGIERLWIHPAIEMQTTLTQHPAIEAALEARVQGDLPRARSAIRQALARHPDNTDALLESLEIALKEDDLAEISRTAARLLDLFTRQGEHELGSQLVYDQRLRPLKLSARFQVSAGAFLEKLGDLRQALQSYQLAVDAASSDPLSLRALGRRAEILAQGGNLREARVAYEQALAHPACNELMRPQIQAALSKLPVVRAVPAVSEDEPEFER